LRSLATLSSTIVTSREARAWSLTAKHARSCADHFCGACERRRVGRASGSGWPITSRFHSQEPGAPPTFLARYNSERVGRRCPPIQLGLALAPVLPAACLCAPRHTRILIAGNQLALEFSRPLRELLLQINDPNALTINRASSPSKCLFREKMNPHPRANSTRL
jgi:hypothetical protein